VGGKTLTPGKYCRTNFLGDSLNLAGEITFDGNGDPNSYFIIYASGGITFNGMTRFIPINGTKKENIFILSENDMYTELAMESFGTFISYKSVNVLALYSKSIKLFSLTGSINIQLSTLLHSSQTNCTINGACYYSDDSCRFLLKDECTSLNGTFLENTKCKDSDTSYLVFAFLGIPLLVLLYFWFMNSDNGFKRIDKY
jgi:hypothetical protein